jgi:hypothetical protein
VTYHFRLHVGDDFLQTTEAIVLEPVTPAKDRDSRVLHIGTTHDLGNFALQVAKLTKDRPNDLNDLVTRLRDSLPDHLGDGCLRLVVHVLSILPAGLLAGEYLSVVLQKRTYGFGIASFRRPKTPLSAERPPE